MAKSQKDRIAQKLFQIKQDLPFSASLAVNFEDISVENHEHDLERETTFYNQALSAVKLALPKLEEEKIPVFRPADYFAEMAKTDDHMQKVRVHLNEIQKTKEKKENTLRVREEKKFAGKAQIAAHLQKQKNKRKLMEAVKSHRKGMREQLETMLENSNDQPAKAAKKSKMTRNDRNKKFGHGGQKKRSKRNDQKSLNSAFNKPRRTIQKKR